MNADVLCSIIAETAYAHFHKFVYELHVILLEKWILCVYVRKSSYTLMGALSTVVVVNDSFKTMCMEHLVSSAYSCIEFIRNKVNIKCSMVWKHVHEHADVIFICRIKHCFHLRFCSYDVVADSPVSRLVIMVPVAFLLIEDLDITAFRAEAGIYGRCLDHSEPGICNLLHVLGNSREVPAPYVKDCFCVGRIRIMRHTVYDIISRL